MNGQVWYHVPPKRSSHTPRPKGGAAAEAKSKVGDRAACISCSRLIVRMEDNAGPESLASLMRL